MWTAQLRYSLTGCEGVITPRDGDGFGLRFRIKGMPPRATVRRFFELFGFAAAGQFRELGAITEVTLIRSPWERPTPQAGARNVPRVQIEHTAEPFA